VAAPFELVGLGWDDAWREAASAYPGRGVPARVARVDRGLCTVWSAEGPTRTSFGAKVLEAVAADPLHTPCTGDWVLARAWPDGPVTVEVVLPRRTAVIRAEASGSSRGQVLAANLDVVGIVVALQPEPNLARVERLLSIAWASGARPVVILTKGDLATDADLIAADVRAMTSEVTVTVTSTTTGRGLDEVRRLVPVGATLGLIGASGQGKSSLINELVGAPTLPTKAIRDDGRGRHTSVRREMVLVPGGGVVIDTPGLRGVGLQGTGGGLRAVFPDIEAASEQCRFRDCMHADEPGCAVRAAVVDGRIAVRRLESWRMLRLEAAGMSSRQAERMRAQAGKRSKFQSKQQKAALRAIRRGQV
jgi:ribosome biogenesis GTPase